MVLAAEQPRKRTGHRAARGLVALVGMVALVGLAGQTDTSVDPESTEAAPPAVLVQTD